MKCASTENLRKLTVYKDKRTFEILCSGKACLL